MKNIEKLFEQNISKKQIRVSLNKNILDIEISEDDNYFTGVQIGLLIDIINAAHKKYGRLKYSINFYLGNTKFIDKLTYVFFECICYYLINEYGHPVQVFMNVKKDIETEGINSSPLLLLNGTKTDSVRQYIKKFHFDIFRYHFRRVINGVGKEDTNYLGSLYEDVDRFLKVFMIDDECRDQVGHVIVELVGNVSEHALTECLIDIDVAPDYKKIQNDKVIDDNYYYGINIAVLNFSDKLLGDDIYHNIIKIDEEEIIDRHKKVKEAYEYHKDFFAEEYTVEDFCNISAFQKKVSGRPDKFETGGTGLPVLIHSLEEKSENHRCYVISGKRCVNFYENLLEYNEEGWIGFNEGMDFLKNIPDEDVITECLIYMPGTAYNFNFIMKGEPINDNN